MARKGATGRCRVLSIDRPAVACSQTEASEAERLSRSLGFSLSACGATSESRSQRSRTFGERAFWHAHWHFAVQGALLLLLFGPVVVPPALARVHPSLGVWAAGTPTYGL